MPSRSSKATSAAAAAAASGEGSSSRGDLFEGVPGGQDQEIELQEDEEEEEEEDEEEDLAGGSVNMQDGTRGTQNGEGEGEAEAEGGEAEAEEGQDEEGYINPQEGDVYDSDSPSDSGTDSLTWITWFCSLPGHEYFAEVTEDFIEDDFNLTGLNALVPFYKEALEMVLDVEPQEDSLKIPDVSIVESSAELLYGLIHQRYILTRQGLAQMVEKYEAGHFGYCPRVFCHSHPVLPCGRSDLPGLDTVKLFCPNCIDNYAPPSSRFHGVDGAFFGTTFPHLLFQCYRDLAPSPIAAPGSYYSSINLRPPSSKNRENGNSERKTPTPPPTLPNPTMRPDQLGLKPSQARLYVPRIYGFRVSEQAKSGPRMRWMRMRPESFEELETGAPPGKFAKVENEEEVELEEDRGPL